MSAKKASKQTAKKIAALSETLEAPAAVPSENAPLLAKDNEVATGTQAGNSSPEAPSRESVATLAAQILSAQITGIAHHETLSAFWTNLRGALKTVGGVLGANELADGVVGESQSRYHAAFQQIRAFIPQPDVLKPVGHIVLESLTQSALRYAETLLSSPGSNHGSEGQIVFAEQIFGRDEELSQNKIRDRFREYHWKNLKGAQTIEDLMPKIDIWYKNWLQDDPRTASHSRAKPNRLAILAQARRVLDEMKLEQDASSALASETSAALTKVIKAAFRPVTEIPRRDIRSGDYELIDWFYYDETPEHRSESRSGVGKADKRIYRPWGLFRYLRLYGDDEKAKEINQKLRCPRALLNPNHTPEALYPDGYGMRPIEQHLYGCER